MLNLPTSFALAAASEPEPDEAPSNLPGTPLKIPIGQVHSFFGSSLSLQYEVSADKSASLQIFAWNGDGRTKGVLLTLNENEFGRLKQLIEKADEVFRGAQP